MSKTLIILVAFLTTVTNVPAQKSLINLVEIPAGSFYMGSEGKGENFDEAPIHKVTLTKSFLMGTTEVTNVQYELFCPEHKKLRGKDGLSIQDDEAVVNVSYQDALDFCAWLSKREGKSYRLPTEAEWEYACRAGTYTHYYTGDGLPAEMMRNQQRVRDYQPVSLLVGQTQPNAFGLYDMHGNVEEWCMDWYGNYSSDEQTNPIGPETGLYRVTRGGSHNTTVEFLRSANRMAMIPEDKHSLTGFRVVQAEPLPIAEPDIEKPYLSSPIPFVIDPNTPNTPFYGHNHQPSITWCDNGDLLAIWFSASDEAGRGMAVLQSRYSNHTHQWTPATEFFRVPDRNVTGSALFNNGKGTIYHLNGVEAAGSWQNLAMIQRISTDNGFSWSRPTIVESEHTKRHQVVAGTSQTKEGWLIQSCDAGPGSHDGASIHISKDGGKTWYDPWDGAPMPDFKDGGKGTTIAGIHAGIVALKDGRLMALGRGNSIKGIDNKLHMPMSISTDLGKTWTYSATDLPPIDGGQRLVLMRLQEGPLLLISFTDHPQRTPENERGMMITDAKGKMRIGYGMYAALSYDEGKTWPVKRLIATGETLFLNGGAWTGNFMMDESHAEPRGYLAATQSPNRWIHLVSSRLYYRFNLKWIEQYSPINK